MIAEALLLIAALSLPGDGSGVPLGIEGLTRLSREMSGLLEGYLEAVPECPPAQDTPIRLWQLDNAWLRASTVFHEVEDSTSASSGAPPAEWDAYLAACRGLLSAYRRTMTAYHGGLPDSALATELENGLIAACSLYAQREAELVYCLREEVEQ